MKPLRAALGDELTKRIDSITIDGQPMDGSARNVLLALCTRSDRNGETEIVPVREEPLLASELEKFDTEQLAALVEFIQHQVWIQKGKIHVSPYWVPQNKTLEEVA